MTAIPHEEEKLLFAKQVSELAYSRLAPWLKALIVGAFALGVWTATIQWRISSIERSIDDAPKHREEVISTLSEIKADIRWLKERSK